MKKKIKIHNFINNDSALILNFSEFMPRKIGNIKRFIGK